MPVEFGVFPFGVGIARVPGTAVQRKQFRYVKEIPRLDFSKPRGARS